MRRSSCLLWGLISLSACGTSAVEPLAAHDAGTAELGVCANAAEWCGEPASCCAGLSCIESNGAMLCARSGGAAVGAPCASDRDCAFRCVTDPRFPGGYCTEPIAECAAELRDGGDANCVPGSLCAGASGPLIRELGAPDLCLAACAEDTDCRAAEGYHCCPHRGGGGVCLPSPGCSL